MVEQISRKDQVVRSTRIYSSMSNPWTLKDWDSILCEKLSRQKRRERLFKEANYKCMQCGYDKRREDGYLTLEIDHIDGNHLNNVRDNLRVLCPNCHALTPNFRNYGRRQERKRSTRAIQKESLSLDKKLEQQYVEEFKKIVLEAFLEKQIDFSKFGWVQRLSELLNDPCPQAVSRRVRKFLPEFYYQNCRIRKWKKTIEDLVPSSNG